MKTHMGSRVIASFFPTLCTGRSFVTVRHRPHYRRQRNSPYSLHRSLCGLQLPVLTVERWSVLTAGKWNPNCSNAQPLATISTELSWLSLSLSLSLSHKHAHTQTHAHIPVFDSGGQMVAFADAKINYAYLGEYPQGDSQVRHRKIWHSDNAARLYLARYGLDYLLKY